MKKTIAFISGVAVGILPVVAFAQNVTYVNNWISNIKDWLGTAVTIIMVLMTIYFLVQVLRFIMNKDATKAKDKKTAMFNALIGLFIALSVWGIINIAQGVFGVRNSQQINPTCPPGTSWSPLNGRCSVN